MRSNRAGNRRPSARGRVRRSFPRVESLEDRRLLATFGVTSTADAGLGTLREAILSANATTGPDIILFNIEGDGQHVIEPLTPLPAITEQVEIQGYTQPGAVANSSDGNDDEETDIAVLTIRIDGSMAGPTADGLIIQGSNSAISGLSITGFGGAGIVIETVDPDNPAVGNRLFGNFVGIDDFNEATRNPVTAESNPFANGLGIRIAASNNRIGGTLPSGRNIIQGNIDAGVLLTTEEGTGNLVEGNFILDNGGDGVLLESSNNFVGEAIGEGPAGGGNVISGNQRGVVLSGIAARGNIIINNEIGTDVGLPGFEEPTRGVSSRPNQEEGVFIDRAPDNSIGGNGGNTRNVIAANISDGIRIQGETAAGNRVRNNYIGFNLRGNVVSILPNQNGIAIAAPRNVIGGQTEGERNTIAENGRNGISISGALATGNEVQGNYIGTIQGGDDFGNSFDGILVDQAPDNLIGGDTPGAGNVISANNNGVVIKGAGAAGNRVLGNFIGPASDGQTDLGNAVDGIVVNSAPEVIIGGTGEAARNVISGNDRGIRLIGSGVTGSFITNNLIGLAADGFTDLGNSIDGILLAGGASGNTIGGATTDSGNLIAFNGEAGVRVTSGNQNRIFSNAIFNNTGLGIDLGHAGVDTNDPGDTDTGPNDLVNAPTLLLATTNNESTSIQGTLLTSPGEILDVQLFSNAVADPTGFGEGQTLLELVEVEADTSGIASFAVNLEPAIAPGLFITATATNSNGNTSEFSNAIPTKEIQLQFAVNEYQAVEADGVATILLTRTGALGGTASVLFSTLDGTAIAGQDYEMVSSVVTFDPGQVNQTVTIPLIDDSEVDQPVTVQLMLSEPSAGVTLGSPETATLVIGSDDQSVLGFSSESLAVDESSGSLTISVIRTGAENQATVAFATRDGTAEAGIDYQPIGGLLAFQPGEFEKQIVVELIGDSLVEGNETFSVSLGAPSGVILAPTTEAIVTLLDDDNPGRFEFEFARMVVGEDFGVAKVTVLRSNGDGGPARVSMATLDNSARAGISYLQVAQILHFAPGESRRVVEIPILDDAVSEPDQAFSVFLGFPSIGTELGSPTELQVTIVDNDAHQAPPVVVQSEAMFGPFGLTAVVLSFSEPIEPNRAVDPTNYEMLQGGPDQLIGTSDDLLIPLAAVWYDPPTSRVALIPATFFPLETFFQVTIRSPFTSSRTSGLTDLDGLLLDGDFDGIPGGTFIAQFRNRQQFN